jgi:tetratricopeptide (TPR) repeat protein
MITSASAKTTMDISPDQLLQLAKERFAVQDYFGCVHLVDDLITSGKAYADAFHLQGLAYHLVGQPDRALAAFDQAIRRNPRYLEALVHKGIVLNEVGRPAEAAKAFAAARDSDGMTRSGLPMHQASKLANQHADLGEAYAEAGDMTAAIEQYRTALDLAPTFHDLRYRLARLLLEVGRSLEARDELEAVVAARPGFKEARAALGMACYVSGDRVSAGEVWSELAQDYPNDLHVNAYLALLERAEGSEDDRD